MKQLAKERLLKKVVIAESGCWEWPHINNRGYGRIKINYKNYATHRLAAHIYLDFDLESKAFICHHCDNPICCNPEHLYIGDQESNMEDMKQRGRQRIVNKKLTQSQVDEIRQSPLSARKLAKLFNVSRSCIRHILQGKTYKEGNPIK